VIATTTGNASSVTIVSVARGYRKFPAAEVTESKWSTTVTNRRKGNSCSWAMKLQAKMGS
jgi:hypothetical protein